MSDQNGSARPIAIYYEHPEWFKKLFDELDRRDVEYEKISSERINMRQKMMCSKWRRSVAVITYTHKFNKA